MIVKDFFSKGADDYAQYRPDYPLELYSFIYKHVKEFSAAWDCATGNGQAAKELSKQFATVHATDISSKQLANAVKASNILYAVASAEQNGLPNTSIDLVTVAQAVHWFDRNQFYKEVKRTAKPGCIVAVWGYALLEVNPKFNALLQNFYTRVVGPYWDDARQLIDGSYSTIEFPFYEIPAPEFKTSKFWDANHLVGYLNTWSAVRKYIEANGHDPVAMFMDVAKEHFGDGIQPVTFTIFLRLGRVQ